MITIEQDEDPPRALAMGLRSDWPSRMRKKLEVRAFGHLVTSGEWRVTGLEGGSEMNSRGPSRTGRATRAPKALAEPGPGRLSE
jgi:hypothetical protein